MRRLNTAPFHYTDTFTSASSESAGHVIRIFIITQLHTSVHARFSVNPPTCLYHDRELLRVCHQPAMNEVSH